MSIKKLKVKIVKSNIGINNYQERNIKNLSLNNTNNEVIMECTHENIGILKKISHLTYITEN